MSLHKILSDIYTLEPFPRAAMQLVEIVADEKRALSEVAGIVMQDPNLTANVLRLANSASYGLKQQVASIDRAVSLLGGQIILEIALISMTAATFKNAQTGYGLLKGEPWRHAMTSAVFAREIAKRYGLKSADVVFTAGLIKDIGKVILDRYMSGAAARIDELIYEKGWPFFEAEKKVLGVDHAELGALAFEKWGFPEKLILIVRNHHLQKTPVVAPRETCAVFLGDTVCSMMGVGTGKDGLNYPFGDEHLLRYFDLQSFDSLVASLYLHLDSIKDLLTTA